ncbi:MAG: DUF3995 domain-containing protein [Sphingobacteriales bacterium]
MRILITALLSLIFIVLSAVHIYWGFGGKSGAAASVPAKESGKPVMNPGKIDCFAVASGLFAFGIFALIKAGVILFVLPNWLSQYGLWVIAAIFLLRAIGEFKYIGFFKKIKTTTFGQMDTKFYSPLCLLISFLGIILQYLS